MQTINSAVDYDSIYFCPGKGRRIASGILGKYRSTPDTYPPTDYIDKGTWLVLTTWNEKENLNGK